MRIKTHLNRHASRYACGELNIDTRLGTNEVSKVNCLRCKQTIRFKNEVKNSLKSTQAK